MKKLFYLIFLQIIVNTSYGQHKWEYSIFHQPGVSGLHNSYDDVFNSDSVDMYFGSSFSQYIGINAAFYKNSKIQIKTGLTLKQLSYNWGVIRSFYDQESLDMIARMDSNYIDWQKTEWKRTDRVYAVPFEINYHFIKSKIDFYILAELTLNYFAKTKNNSIDYFPDEILYNKSDFADINVLNRKFFLSSSAGIGFNIKITDKIGVEAEPRIEYFYQDMEHTAPLYGNYFNISLKTGLYYMF